MRRLLERVNDDSDYVEEIDFACISNIKMYTTKEHKKNLLKSSTSRRTSFG